MLILGDVATYRNNITLRGDITDDILLLNCEGFLSENIDNDNNVVFNNVEFYVNLSKKYRVILNLANNHTMDVVDGVSQSLELAKKYELSVVGGGRNLEEACASYVLIDMVEVAIVVAGWEVIGCKPARVNAEGVAPLSSKNLINRVEVEKNKNRKVLVYLHWGYELEIYPHPTHRNLAKDLVDAGADIVIGCHSHCLQGFEKYNNKYIFYGVGNSIFDENYYVRGKLKFPNFCQYGLVVKWEPSFDSVQVAETHYKDGEFLCAKFDVPENNERLCDLSLFSTMNEVEYLYFFKKHRRKRNLLPIFYEKDTSLSYRLKIVFLKIRAFLIKKMFLLGVKGGSR